MGMTTHTLRRRHHVALADRLAAPAPNAEALAVRRALARPVDAEFARRLRYVVLESEVSERLRAL
jgi:hypothetical protein